MRGFGMTTWVFAVVMIPPVIEGVVLVTPTSAPRILSVWLEIGFPFSKDALGKREKRLFLFAWREDVHIPALDFLACPRSFSQEGEAALDRWIELETTHGDAGCHVVPAVGFDQLGNDAFQGDAMEWIFVSGGAHQSDHRMLSEQGNLQCWFSSESAIVRVIRGVVGWTCLEMPVA